MPRYQLLLEYDGTHYLGWQRQQDGPSIQQTLEEALAQFIGEEPVVHASGRTDAGVHALGQVAHVDLPKELPPYKIQDALNFFVRERQIAVLAVKKAPETFHARFSAVERGYLYRIINRRAPLALERTRAWHVVEPLDAERMHRAAQYLVGQHDFTSFRASECQAKSPVKTLGAIAVCRAGEEIQLTVRARSFLHHQVRNLTGTLRLVGSGVWEPEKILEILASRNRSAAGPTAPPHGLYLNYINYPEIC